jgi:hypothetical protein
MKTANKSQSFGDFLIFQNIATENVGYKMISHFLLCVDPTSVINKPGLQNLNRESH